VLSSGILKKEEKRAIMKKFLLVTVVVVVMLGLVLSGCAKPAPAPGPAPAPTPAPAPAPPAGPDEILIGSAAPMTGMFAGFGAGCTFGVQAAVDDINKLGGIYVKEYDRKIPVKLVIADQESDPVKAGTLSEKLAVQDKVNAFYSCDMPCSMHGPTAMVADKYKIPHIIGGGPLEPWLHGLRESTDTNWPYTWFPGFGIATPPPEGDFRYGKPGYTIKDTWFEELDTFADQTNKVAGVFATDEPDGIGWYNSFPGLLKEYGLDVIGVEDKVGFFPLDATDLTPIIHEWMDNDVQILWGNCPGPNFGNLWRQCYQEGFRPKIVSCGRAPLFYVDVNSWGGNLPNGIFTEIWWAPEYECPGIGDTTPQSLAQRWVEAKNEPLNRGIGHGYAPAQVLFDAIERAGTLDGEAINKAMGETDLMTINYEVKFDPATHFSWIPLFVGQWRKTDAPEVWQCPIVFSKHDFLPSAADPIFPVPYE